MFQNARLHGPQTFKKNSLKPPLELTPYNTQTKMSECLSGLFALNPNTQIC